MYNETTYRLIGTDEDDNALFYCSFCENIIVQETDGTDNIEMYRLDDTCPECGAKIIRIDLE